MRRDENPRERYHSELAMTVTPENLPFLREAIEFGLRPPNVRGIS